jgi:autotransporter-associated beta strand protein
MKRFYVFLLAFLLVNTSLYAQRFTDALDRGLVSLSGSTGNFVSWRRQAEEYYDVTYNVYRDDIQVAVNLKATHFVDTGGNKDSKYEVRPVVRGVEQAENNNKVGRWEKQYLDIKLTDVFDRNKKIVTDHYIPNDAEMADLNGDGDLEIIIKRLNTVDAANIYPVSNTTEFVMLDAYDVDWQTGKATLMWRIDCGPNMVSLNSTEINIIAYDWDEDGSAEVVLRGADNMIVYGSDGQTPLYNIGDMNVNTRNEIDSHTIADRAWTRTGNEYLIYMDGNTGALYQKIDYPLTRESADAWGLDSKGQPEGYGHRSSKYFFGAPFLNGQNASLFLARGIYGRHKMMAMNLDRTNHTWGTRWTWNNNTMGSPWYGQGYHNFLIADVDEDGRDEIVYGSMVIDDTGNGLSTTGLGHGDAQHVSDFDPYRKGLEFFGCNEDNPGMNYRNATTSEYYRRVVANSDDGRGIMANFSNSYPGSLGRSVSSNIFSSVTDNEIPGLEGDNYIVWDDLNFRIYWDGDLLSEILDSPGTEREAMVFKPGVGRIFLSSDCNMNNASKNNPCFQGDIIGDWREELVLRCGSDLRVYTSTSDTEYDLYTLWHDHQYRQAMVWQMMAYNQPPHLSFFLGEMEGFTLAPPPLTNTGRTIITSSINAQHNDLHVMACEQADMSISVSDNAAPYIFTDNAPSHVQGNDDNDNISYTYYTHTITGSGFTGDMRLVKQGDGTLVLPPVNESYTGPTEVWAGTLQFNGTMEHSKVFMHRHTALNTSQGTFSSGVSMEYGASLNIGGASAGNFSSVNISELTLGYGSKVVFDVKNSEERDWLALSDLVIDESKYSDRTWKQFGPKYIMPVFYVSLTNELDEGTYAIGHAGSVKSDSGRDITSGETLNIDVDCDQSVMNPDYLSVFWDGGTIYLKVDKSVELELPEISFLRMERYDGVGDVYPSANPEDYWLPVVGLKTEETATGAIPELSGTFTNLNGETTTFGKVSQTILYEDTYDSGINGWSSPNAGDYLHHHASGYVEYNITTNENDRNAVLELPKLTIPSTASVYTIEFDAAITPGNNNDHYTQLTVLAGGSVINNNTYDITKDGYLFSMINQGASSTNYTINGSSTANIPSGAWCHYKIEVNLGSTPTASYTIINKQYNSTIATGTRSITDGNTIITKINFLGGRYRPKLLFDNISVVSGASNPTEFRFTEPGTLELTASLNGYRSSTATYEVELPYYRYYHKKFSEINGSNIATLLGSKWNTTATTTRWANWSRGNATYGESYQMYYATVSNDPQFWLSPDNEPKIVYMENNGGGNRTAAVVESFGIGRNDTSNGSTFHVVNVGNEKTFIYYDFDESWGNADKHGTAWVNANEDGSCTIATGSNNTLAELGVYVPVMIHDELCTTLPERVTNANAVIYRTGLNSTNTWASLVLPFSVEHDNIAAIFGPAAVVANLQSSDSHTLYFDTQTAAINANQPVLVKNVSMASPYLFFNLSSNPLENPTQTLDNGLQFIGSYINQPNKPFYLTDYFFTSSTDEDNPEGKISQVSTNGMTMNMKGYRAYFKLPGTSAGKSLAVRFDDNGTNAIITAVAEQKPVDVFNLAGQVVRRNAQDLRGLPRGLYIIGGRLVTVK